MFFVRAPQRNVRALVTRDFIEGLVSRKVRNGVTAASEYALHEREDCFLRTGEDDVVCGYTLRLSIAKPRFSECALRLRLQ